MKLVRLIKLCLNETYSTIKKVQGSQMGLNLDGAHQFQAYAYDVNLLGDNIGNINKKKKQKP
jgi:hypothetical protein